VIRAALIALVLACASRPAVADPAALLAGAAARLETAETRVARLAALADATAAQETAMLTLRANLRAMPERRAAIEARLGVLDAEAFAVLGALDRVLRAPPGAYLAHPAGPLAAVRAAGIAGEMAAGLSARAQALLDATAALAALEEEQSRALALLGQALEDFTATRAELMAAAGGDAVPAYLAAVDSLPRLIETLAAVPTDPVPGVAQHAALVAARGRLPLPVGGEARREGFGVVIRAPGWALVRSPVRATVRFAGDLPPLGGVVVLEPAPDATIVLQGLGAVAALAGDVVEAGQPVGHLGRPVPSADEFLMTSGENGTVPSPQSLYMELWRDGRREDAAGWFALDPPRPARLQ
jgi:septal ring factor EnvC (AmiA/AmiB activator)